MNVQPARLPASFSEFIDMSASALIPEIHLMWDRGGNRSRTRRATSELFKSVGFCDFPWSELCVNSFLMMPDLQPILKGRRITLRPLCLEDFEALYLAASDPVIWEQHFEPNRCERSVFTKFFEKAVASKSTLVIIENCSEEIIGTSRFDRYNPEDSEIEIGYTFLARRYWGNGYNTELKELMIEYAFSFVERIHFYVYEKNYRSQRAVEKLGAKKIKVFEGPHHKSFLYELSQPMQNTTGIHSPCPPLA